jgi:hypothetical protein
MAAMIVGSGATLESLRRDYRRTSGRSIALPIAGTIIWAAIGFIGSLVSPATAALVLLFGSGLIFPIGLIVARILGERILDNRNPLARLMGLAVLMVNLLWPIHIAFFLQDPTALPLSVGIALGIHWIVFGWIIRHPVGLFHALARTILVTVAWFALPGQRFTIVPAVIVIVYLVTILVLVRVRPPVSEPAVAPA